MKVVEVQFEGGLSSKTSCDLCGEEPENGALVEKPNSMIINGQVLISHRAETIHICLDCLTFEIENM